MTQLIDRSVLSLSTPGFYLRPDYYELLHDLRQQGPLVACADPGMWALTRYEEIRALGRDTSRFCSRRGVLINDPLRTGDNDIQDDTSILHLDPPQHAKYRSIVNRQFTPRAIDLLAMRIREIVVGVVEAIPADTDLDLIDAFTAPVPVLVIADMLGVDASDLPRFRRGSDAMIDVVDHPTHDNMMGAADLVGFLHAHAEERRAEPGDDMISRLWQSEYEGQTLSPEQVKMFGISLLVAGNETTRHLLSGMLYELHRHPDQRAALVADPALIPGAVEEGLRWVTPIQAFGRTALADTELCGQDIASGDFVVMLYASGNRDETVFGPTANEFNVHRVPSQGQVSFGFGEHLCLGAALARVEARIALEELLKRFPHFSTGEPEYVESTLVRGMKTLPGRFGS
jgi:cytochrome P450